MADIVKRLRDKAEHEHEMLGDIHELLLEAAKIIENNKARFWHGPINEKETNLQQAWAKEIVNLREKVEKLSCALKPFAAFAESWEKSPLRGIDNTIYSIHGGESCGGAELKLSDLKNAKEVYEKKGAGNE